MDNPLLSATSNKLYSVFFVDQNIGWAAGDGGTIMKTTNGGISFVEESEISEIPSDYYLSNNYPNPLTLQQK